eukprot:gene16824-17005_t
MPDLRIGGAEKVAVNLANAFVARGYGVDMVLMEAVGGFLEDLVPEVRVVNLAVRRARHLPVPLFKYIKQRKPDCLLGCMWPITVVAVWARMFSGVKTRVVVAEHTTWSKAEIISSVFVRWAVKVSMRLSYPLADAVVAVSRGAADDLARFCFLKRDMFSAIYNPIVDKAQRQSLPLPAAPIDWCLGSHKRLLAVGTLKEIKDFPTLLQALKFVSAEIDVKLLILGEGSCRALLERQVIELGLDGKVFMPGVIHDPGPYFAHADLLVLSSTGEGLPTVIVEALAAGTPVVSTDCESGPREILADGEFGTLVPVGDAAALAKGIIAALSVEHDKDRLRARAQDFSIDKAVDQYEKLMFPAKFAGQAS